MTPPPPSMPPPSARGQWPLAPSAPAGRPARPANIKTAIKFLVTGASAFCLAAVLFVIGGATAFSAVNSVLKQTVAHPAPGSFSYKAQGAGTYLIYQEIASAGLSPTWPATAVTVGGPGGADVSVRPTSAGDPVVVNGLLYKAVGAVKLSPNTSYTLAGSQPGSMAIGPAHAHVAGIFTGFLVLGIGLLFSTIGVFGVFIGIILLLIGLLARRS